MLYQSASSVENSSSDVTVRVFFEKSQWKVGRLVCPKPLDTQLHFAVVARGFKAVCRSESRLPILRGTTNKLGSASVLQATYQPLVNIQYRQYQHHALTTNLRPAIFSVNKLGFASNQVGWTAAGQFHYFAQFTGYLLVVFVGVAALKTINGVLVRLGFSCCPNFFYQLI